MSFWQKAIAACIAVCRALVPDCRDAARAQSEMLDRALPPARRTGLWLHLLLCQWCRRYGLQIRFLRDAAREHQDELAGTEADGLSEAARERIKWRLRDGNGD